MPNGRYKRYIPFDCFYVCTTFNAYSPWMQRQIFASATVAWRSNRIGKNYCTCMLSASHLTCSLFLLIPVCPCSWEARTWNNVLEIGVILTNIDVCSNSEWYYLQGLKDRNIGCQFNVVGRQIKHLSAGFAVQHSQDKCSWLVRDVIDIYMQEMSNEGAWGWGWAGRGWGGTFVRGGFVWHVGIRKATL